MSDVLPDEVRDFIIARIESIAQIEALLLLAREPVKSWDARMIADRLYISENAARTLLDRMDGGGLVAADASRFRFRSDDAELRRLVDQLAHYYATHLIPVTNLIHNKPSRIQEFADAFKLKKGT